MTKNEKTPKKNQVLKFSSMHTPYKMENTEKPQREKPSPQLVSYLMNLYPKLDYLMVETILSLSEEQLGEMLDEKEKEEEKIST